MTDIEYIGVFSDDFDRASEGGRIAAKKGGRVAGGGAEYRISRFSIKGEYLHARFADMKVVSRNLTIGPLSNLFPVPENPFTHSANLSTNILRVGVNLYF